MKAEDLDTDHKATENQSDMVRSLEVENDFGRDTGLCGDPKYWFPMRVTYGRELKVKAELERLKIENFLPMKYAVVDIDTENPRSKLVPAIKNLIFIRSTKSAIQDMKTRNSMLQPLRYMVDHTAIKAHTVMTIPERQMQNFMLVASHYDENVIFLDEKSIKGKEGKRVLVTDGIFKGVTGVIRRVKRCKRVVVELEGVASVAIAFVPGILLKEIEC